MQQGKARLELANQTLRLQHQKELETRDEELEEIKGTTSKKVLGWASNGVGYRELHIELDR